MLMQLLILLLQQIFGVVLFNQNFYIGNFFQQDKLMVKFNRQFFDNLFFTLYLGWLFAIDWIWYNSSGHKIMIMYFGSNLTLKAAHFIWYLSSSSQTENCCGQLVKWLGLIGSLLKLVDIRQVMLGTQINNGATKQYTQLALNLVSHSFNLAYILISILYFYFNKRRKQQKKLRHIPISVSSTSYF